MNRIKENDFESWITEWTSTASRVSLHAEKLLEIGYNRDACMAFLKASNYYRLAVFYVHFTDSRHTELWEQSKVCFQKMIQSMEHPIEYLEINFEEAKLPAYFISSGKKYIQPSLLWVVLIQQKRKFIVGSELLPQIMAGIVLFSKDLSMGSIKSQPWTYFSIGL